jgi:hypothetical protein
LFGLFVVCVEGIQDIQLMELASRGFQKRHVNGLARCIENDSRLSLAEKRGWKASKENGRKLFDPKLGGGYAVFDERPLSTEIKKYCVQDVVHMPALRELYRAKLCDVWWSKIEAETAARVNLSQSKHFNGQGMHMAKAPAGWEYFRPSWAERQSRVLLTLRRDSAVTPPAPIRRVISSQVDSGQEPDSDLAAILGALNIQGNRSGRRSSYRDEFRFDDGDDSDRYDGDDRDFTAYDSECGYCGGCSY